MRANPVRTLAAVPGFNADLRRALLGSAASHRCLLAIAATALLVPAPALAQCAAPPAAVNLASGSCDDPAFTTRESPGTVVDVTGNGRYSATATNLLVTDSGYGARAADNGTIVLTGSGDSLTEITTYGAGSHGLVAEDGGQITGDNTSVYTNDADAYGLEATGEGSGITLTDSGINTYGDGAYGAHAASGATISLTRSDIQTYGVGASAVVAEAGASVSLDTMSTFSSGDSALGAMVSGAGSSLILNNGYLNTFGNDSTGLLVTDGGTATLNGGAVTTGDYFGDIVVANSPAIVARGVGSSIQVGSGATAATYGANSPGLWADAGATIDFAGYGIFTYQPASAGAIASGSGSRVTLTDTIVRTSGPASAGVLVNGAGTVSVTGSEITSGYIVGGSNPPVLQFPDSETGLESAGVDVIGTGSRLEAENDTITTNGDGAIGVRVSQGATASITGSTIFTNGADTAAVGGADGVRATDDGSSVALSDSLITTTNINAVGVHAMAGGAIAAADVTIATQGRNGHGAEAEDAGSTIILARATITTDGDAAAGLLASNAGGVEIADGSIATTGNGAHGLAAIDGGALTASQTAVTVTGAGSSPIYLAGSAPGTISITGGSLGAANGAIVLAEGGTGTVSISGGTEIVPATVNDRPLLAYVTEDEIGAPSNLTLNITGLAALTGDIVVDPSTLAFNLGDSDWTGDLVLIGPDNIASINLNGSQWTGDLLADGGNSADVTLAQDSSWTGFARNATNVTIDAGSAWNITGDSNAAGIVGNAGLVQFLARPDAYTTLTIGNYTGGAGSRIAFNTYLGADDSPTNLLVINGGQASGTSSVLINNSGGPGAQTLGDGIRLVAVTNGGTTTTDAFVLGQRVAAGAYEYELFRGGSTDPNDWFLRSHLIDTSAGPTTPGGPDIPLFRPEVPLYAPIPALSRQLGLATLGTLHERVGEEENLRGVPEPRAYANGAWGRVLGERMNSRWSGTADSRADGSLFGLQAGIDILRRTTRGGHRDHVGVYVAYADYRSSSIRGFAMGEQDLPVGRLRMNGPSVGAYWTHFGPSGWYLDAVIQKSWYDAKAISLYGEEISTDAKGYAASLEAGYPIRWGADHAWLIEPQAQIVYQGGVSVDGTQDRYSTVDWDPGNAWTGRLGARLQYSARDARGTLWQPYARINLWHAFSGIDAAFFGSPSSAIETRFGDTSLEAEGGFTARANRNVSFYAQAGYRRSIDGGRSRQSATAGSFGVRLNW